MEPSAPHSRDSLDQELPTEDGQTRTRMCHVIDGWSTATVAEQLGISSATAYK
jgi:hypothetical protein